MITAHYHITFKIQLKKTRFFLPMQADVEVHHSEAYYVIKNINTGSRGIKSVFPDITIQKKDGRWIDQDSGKESHLSIRVGQAIEALSSAD